MNIYNTKFISAFFHTLLFSHTICIGTIADREHRKWIEKAVPLQNNPYSKESLEKRLSRTSVDSGTSTLQSRWVHFLMSFVCSLLLEDYYFHFVWEYNSVLMKYLRRKNHWWCLLVLKVRNCQWIFSSEKAFFSKKVQKRLRFNNSENKLDCGNMFVIYSMNS